MKGGTYSVATADVLRLAVETEHPTYDCEYVALAQELDVTLVTGDTTVATRFSDTAALLEDVAAGGRDRGACGSQPFTGSSSTASPDASGRLRHPRAL